MKLPGLILLISVLATSTFAQGATEKFKTALMEMKGGAEVVYSSDSHSFTLDIISDNIKPLQSAGYLSVDKKVLQYVRIPGAFEQHDVDTDEKIKAKLLGYMQYELKYIKDEVKMDYSNLKYDWISNHGVISLLWYYDMPAEMAAKENGVQKQINLSTLCFSNILNLNTPVSKGDNFEDDKALLTKTIATLKLNDFKIDFGELYKKLHQQ